MKYEVIRDIFKGHVFNGTPIVICDEPRIWDDDSVGRAYPAVDCRQIKEEHSYLQKTS
jgi:hypothetical protein